MNADPMLKLQAKLKIVVDKPRENIIFDWLVDSHIETRSPIRFLQLGAYDGTGDEFQEKYLWPGKHPDFHGLLVEPSPAAFKHLNSMVNSRPELAMKIRCLNKAVHPMGKKIVDFFLVDEGRLLKEWDKKVLDRYGINNGYFQRISTLNRGHLIKHLEKFRLELPSYKDKEEFFNRFIYKISIETISPKELIHEFVQHINKLDDQLKAIKNFEFIDLLIIDVEGVDLAVLELLLKENIFPKVIVYEDVHINQEKARSLLIDHGYMNVDLYGYNSAGIRIHETD